MSNLAGERKAETGPQSSSEREADPSRRGRDKEDFVEERAYFTGLYVQFYMST